MPKPCRWTRSTFDDGRFEITLRVAVVREKIADDAEYRTDLPDAPKFYRDLIAALERHGALPAERNGLTNQFRLICFAHDSHATVYWRQHTAAPMFPFDPPPWLILELAPGPSLTSSAADAFVRKQVAAAKAVGACGALFPPAERRYERLHAGLLPIHELGLSGSIRMALERDRKGMPARPEAK